MWCLEGFQHDGLDTLINIMIIKLFMTLGHGQEREKEAMDAQTHAYNVPVLDIQPLRSGEGEEWDCLIARKVTGNSCII